jgi:crossover junction endodeoxyribonuclease RuvC
VNTQRIFLGVDPGKSGAIAAIDASGAPVGHIRASETDRDLFLWLSHWQNSCAMVERVHAMPRQGVVSCFKFGQSFGSLRMALACAGVPYELVTPAKWQQVMKCRSRGDKNVTKARAQELFPSVRMTHAIADAYLLAAYARHYQGNGQS